MITLIAMLLRIGNSELDLFKPGTSAMKGLTVRISCIWPALLHPKDLGFVLYSSCRNQSWLSSLIADA